MGTILGVPISILGSILGSPYFRKLLLEPAEPNWRSLVRNQDCPLCYPEPPKLNSRASIQDTFGKGDLQNGTKSIPWTLNPKS